MFYLLIWVHDQKILISLNILQNEENRNLILLIFKQHSLEISKISEDRKSKINVEKSKLFA